MTKLIDKLASQEAAFLKSAFVAPVLRGRPVAVRIAGAVCQFRVRSDFQGWGVFRPKNYKLALFVRQPSMAEKAAWLEPLPCLRLILCREGECWHGVPARAADARFKVEGLVPVRLASGVQLFDQVKVRFDGFACWFEGIDEGVSGGVADQMRGELANGVELTMATTEERIAAYNVAWNDRQAVKAMLEDERKRAYFKTTQGRIEDALGRAGAKYRGHVDRGGAWSVTYEVDGKVHTSTVDAGLNVVSAGICLTDHRTGRKGDADQDLGSLVSVLREGYAKGKIVRYDGAYDNDGDEEDW